MEFREALRRASVRVEPALSAADVPAERYYQISEWYGGRYISHPIAEGEWRPDDNVHYVASLH